MRSVPIYVEYIILCFCLCLGVLSTALASPLYAIYAAEWHISTSQIGYAFIAYMLGVVFSLLFFNNSSNKFGFKKVMMMGLIICIASLAYSAIAPNVWHLCLARFFIGISSGLLCTSTIVGLALKFPFANKANAGKISSVITVFGFGLGPLIGGIIADHSINPLSTPYWIIAALSFITLCFSPLISYQHTLPKAITKSHVWNTPQSKQLRKIFFPCALTACCAFAIFSLYAALAGTFISQLPLKQSATLTGISISVILFISTLTQFCFKGLHEAKSLMMGLGIIVLGCLSLILAQFTGSVIWLFISIILIGFGHGLALNPAYYFMGMITQKENPAIFSTFLLIAYQGTIWPILLSSIIIDHYGVMASLVTFSVLILVTVIWIVSHLKTIQLKSDEMRNAKV